MCHGLRVSHDSQRMLQTPRFSAADRVNSSAPVTMRGATIRILVAVVLVLSTAPFGNTASASKPELAVTRALNKAVVAQQGISKLLSGGAGKFLCICNCSCSRTDSLSLFCARALFLLVSYALVRLACTAFRPTESYTRRRAELRVAGSQARVH